MQKLRTKSGASVSDLRHLGFENRKRWYVLADRTHAAVYQDLPGDPFRLIWEVSHPDAAKPERDLVSDRPGRTFSSVVGKDMRHALDRGAETHHEKLVQDFAKEISQYLESGIRDRFVSDIALFAEPQFLGVLRKRLSRQVRKHVIWEVSRAYHGESAPELRRQVLAVLAKLSA